jgi:hypothetical protein
MDGDLRLDEPGRLIQAEDDATIWSITQMN